MLHGDPGFDPIEGHHLSGNLIWDPSTLEWIKATGSLAGGTEVEVTNFPASFTTGGTVSVTFGGTVTVTSGQTSVTFGQVSVTHGVSTVNALQSGTWTVNVVPAGSFTNSTQTVTFGTATVTHGQSSVTFGQTSVTFGVSTQNAVQSGTWNVNVVPAGSFTNSTQTVTFGQSSCTFGVSTHNIQSSVTTLSSFFIGNSGVAADVGGTTFRAIKQQSNPIDHGTLGAYQLSMTSGTIVANLTAGSEIYHFRWLNAGSLALVRAVICDGMQSLGNSFSVGIAKLEVTPARAWNGDGTGGTTAVLSGNNQKLRTSMSTSNMNTGTVRIASTTALGGGTKTTDAQPIAVQNFAVTTTPNANQLAAGTVLMHAGDIYDFHPLVLSQSEGFVIKTRVPITGTWQIGFTVRWTEVTSY